MPSETNKLRRLASSKPLSKMQKFEIKNKYIRESWFYYDSITAFLAITGLLTLCVQKYISIYLLKNECLEKGMAGCEERMYNHRYLYNDTYAWIVISLNVPCVITFFIGNWYKQQWLEIKLDDNNVRKDIQAATKVSYFKGIDFIFLIQLFLLILAPIPGYKKIFYN